MTKTELINLEATLNTEYAQRQRLGGYSADAGGLLLLTRACLMMARHLTDVEKELAKLKRGVTSVRVKKKK